MLSEQEARELLRDNKVERNPLDNRSCLEIAADLGIVACEPLGSVHIHDTTDEVIEV